MKTLNVVRVLSCCTLASALITSLQTTVHADPVKIGFVVKQPEEPWFQDEWRFAEQAAKEKNFTVVKIGAEVKLPGDPLATSLEDARLLGLRIIETDELERILSM